MPENTIKDKIGEIEVLAGHFEHCLDQKNINSSPKKPKEVIPLEGYRFVNPDAEARYLEEINESAAPAEYQNVNSSRSLFQRGDAKQVYESLKPKVRDVVKDITQPGYALDSTID